MQYRLYVDESGDHTFNNLDDIGHRYLALVGIAIEADYYRSTFQPRLEALKQTHFPHNPDEPVVLHREDIYNRRYCFGILCDEEKNNRWEQDVITFVKESKFRLFTIVIDKKAHKEKYGASANHPYHLCLTFLLERYRGYLLYVDGKGDVMAESRGKEQDMALKEVYRDVWWRGTFYISNRNFQSVLTSRELKLKTKLANIAGLQFADLLAHSAKMEILSSRGRVVQKPCFGTRLAETFRSKYDLIGRKLFD